MKKGDKVKIIKAVMANGEIIASSRSWLGTPGIILSVDSSIAAGFYNIIVKTKDPFAPSSFNAAELQLLTPQLRFAFMET